jgi:hypothetical protein
MMNKAAQGNAVWFKIYEGFSNGQWCTIRLRSNPAQYAIASRTISFFLYF